MATVGIHIAFVRILPQLTNQSNILSQYYV